MQWLKAEFIGNVKCEKSQIQWKKLSDCNGKSYMQWEKPNAREKMAYKRK